MYNPTIKLRQNIDAIKVALQYKEGDAVTQEQIDIVSKFSGWGGIKCVLYNPYNDEEWISASVADKGMRESVRELHEILKEELPGKEYKKAVDSMKAAVLTSYYTPEVVIKTLYKVLKKYMYVDKYYDPCAGTGLFLTAGHGVINMNMATLYEKDLLTYKVLRVIVEKSPVPVTVYNKGFEESLPEEDGKYSLLASNVPFGAIPVWDPTITDRNLTGKIHAYFLAKGISKLQDGGVMAVLVTDAFLNSPTGKSARRYLFERCDLLSVIVMPDNLYKQTAGTEAPSHLVVVRKNTDKTVLSEEEELLCESSVQEYMGIKVAMNHWVMQTDYSPYIGVPEPGKNQYGKPALEVRWLSPIENIAQSLEEILTRDLDRRYYTQEELQEKEENKAQEWVQEHIIVAGIPKDNQELKEKGFEVQSLTRPITLSDIPDKVKMFMPKHQQQVIVGSEEHWDILRNLENIIEQIPGPYGQDEVPADDKIVYLHYFYGGCDWYITERDEWGIQYQMFGYANLGDDDMAEWGYVGVPELEDSRVELDLFWKPCRFCDIDKEQSEQVDTDVASICSNCGVGMFGTKPICYRCEEEQNKKSTITLPHICSVEPVKGTIIQVEGKLLQIDQVNSDNTVTVVEPDIKAGKEADVMSAYLAIRDTFVELEKEQEKW